MLRAEWATLLFGVAAVALILWLGHNLFVLHLGANHIRSDYWEHTASIRALMDAPFQPRNPQLGTDAASPRFTPGFVLLSLAGRGCGLDPFEVMALSGTVNVVLLLAGIFLFFRLYFRDARAPLYGLIVMLCSWYHGFPYSNVYQLRLLFQLAGYPSTAAVALTLITFAIAIYALRETRPRWWLVLLLLSTTNVILTHALTATMTLTGVIAMAWFEPEIPWRRRRLVIGAALAACFLVELWPYFSTWHLLGTGDEVDMRWPGLEELDKSDTGTKDLAFYNLFPLVRTLGFSVLGCGALAYFVFTGRHRFVVAGALTMFLPFVVNPIIELPLGHRFILLTIPFLQIGLVWMLLKATPGFHEGWWRLNGGAWRRWLAVGAVVGTLAAMAYINVEKAVRASNVSRRAMLSHLALCHAVAEAVGPDAIVLSDKATSWPLPTCGTKIVALLHPNPFVPDHRARQAAVESFLDPDTRARTRQKILDHYRVTHVLGTPDPPPALRKFLLRRFVRRPLPGDYVLYTLRQ